MKKLIVIIIFLSSVGSVFAKANATAQLEALLKTMQTYQAEFTQQVKDKQGTVLQEAAGSVWFKRPDKFRWETHTPTKETIVAKGLRLWTYDPDLAQATVQDLTQNNQESPAVLMTKTNIELAKHYEVTLKEDKTSQEYILKPRKQLNSDYEMIKFYFVNHQLTSFKVLNNLEQWNTLNFSKVKVNLPIADKLFTFHVPPHVDVINNTAGSLND